MAVFAKAQDKLEAAIGHYALGPEGDQALIDAVVASPEAQDAFREMLVLGRALDMPGLVWEAAYTLNQAGLGVRLSDAEVQMFADSEIGQTLFGGDPNDLQSALDRPFGVTARVLGPVLLGSVAGIAFIGDEVVGITDIIDAGFSLADGDVPAFLAAGAAIFSAFPGTRFADDAIRIGVRKSNLPTGSFSVSD